jgi:hypothetical protein
MGRSISIIFRAFLFIIPFMKPLHVIIVLVIVCIGHIIFLEEGTLAAKPRGDGMTSDEQTVNLMMKFPSNWICGNSQQAGTKK